MCVFMSTEAAVQTLCSSLQTARVEAAKQAQSIYRLMTFPTCSEVLPLCFPPRLLVC